MFRELEAIIRENPHVEELEIMWMTDGQASYQEDYASILAIKNNPKIKSRYMTIGFSRGHNAQIMNHVANSGSEQGNFVFVDTQGKHQGELEKDIGEALGESLDVALGSDSSVKFCIENAQENYSETMAGEIGYTTVEQEDENEEAAVEVLVSVQRIQPTRLINDLLTAKLVTAVKEIDCKLVVETVMEPKPEIRIRATLKLYN